MIGREVRKGPSAQAAGALANVGSAYIVDTRVHGRDIVRGLLIVICRVWTTARSEIANSLEKGPPH
jgi:hypothetical protein